MQAGLGVLGERHSSFWETLLFINASKEMTEIAKRKLKSCGWQYSKPSIYKMKKKSFKHFLLEVQESLKKQSD